MLALALLFWLIFKTLLLLLLAAIGGTVAVAGAIVLVLPESIDLPRLTVPEGLVLILLIGCGFALFLGSASGIAGYIMPPGPLVL